MGVCLSNYGFQKPRIWLWCIKSGPTIKLASSQLPHIFNSLLPLGQETLCTTRAMSCSISFRIFRENACNVFIVEVVEGLHLMEK